MSVAEPVLHVDMDAFYASVEAIKDPSLRGRPVVVGGLGNRGVVTSASYEARAFGVASAMPIVQARRLCPHAVFLPNDFDAYVAYSRRIRDIFCSFTPVVEPLSLDEAFLDVRGSVRLFGPPEDIGRAIRERVAGLGLRCSVGVAPNRLVAKLASRRAKPDGLVVVRRGDVRRFLDPLPVEELWGVGEQTAAALHRLGLRSVGQLAAASRSLLQRALGDVLGAQLHDLARGIDERPVTPEIEARSVGCEETFETDLDSADDILRELLRLSDRAAARLRAKGLCGRTVTIKVRFSNFRTVTRSITLEREVDGGHEVYDAARILFRRVDPDRPRVRLLGVTVSGLAPGPPRWQGELLGRPAGSRRRAASLAIDAIRTRFGDSAVAPGALLETRGDRI